MEMCGVKTARFFVVALIFVQIFLAPTTHAAKTTIRVHVQAVRYITVDSKGTILKIESNTPENVTPIVLSTSNSRMKLTQEVDRQYDALITTIDTSKTGTIYDKNKPEMAKKDSPTLISQIWLFALAKSLFRSGPYR